MHARTSHEPGALVVLLVHDVDLLQGLLPGAGVYAHDLAEQPLLAGAVHAVLRLVEVRWD